MAHGTLRSRRSKLYSPGTPSNTAWRRGTRVQQSSQPAVGSLYILCIGKPNRIGLVSQLVRQHELIAERSTVAHDTRPRLKLKPGPRPKAILDIIPNGHKTSCRGSARHDTTARNVVPPAVGAQCRRDCRQAHARQKEQTAKTALRSAAAPAVTA